jgi:hypothetical protein
LSSYTTGGFSRRKLVTYEVILNNYEFNSIIIILMQMFIVISVKNPEDGVIRAEKNMSGIRSM